MTGEKKAVEQKKTVRVRHLLGQVLAINAKTKTITVRFRDEALDVQFDDTTVVKIDLDTVKPSEIPVGTRVPVHGSKGKASLLPGESSSPRHTVEKIGISQSFLLYLCKTGSAAHRGFSPHHNARLPSIPRCASFPFRTFDYREQKPETDWAPVHGENIARQADQVFQKSATWIPPVVRLLPAPPPPLTVAAEGPGSRTGFRVLHELPGVQQSVENVETVD